MVDTKFKKMSWARLTKKLSRSRSVSTFGPTFGGFKKGTSPSISEETVNSITSVLGEKNWAFFEMHRCQKHLIF